MYKVIKEYISTLIECIISEDFGNAAAEMAYMLAIGIFPFMLFLTAVFGWLGKKIFVTKIIAALSTVAPSGVIDLIQSVLREVTLFQNGGIMAAVGFIVTWFLASNAIAVIIKGLNRANRVKEERSFIHTRLLAAAMVILNAFLLFISVNLVIFGNVIINFLQFYFHMGDRIANMMLITRWPLAFILLFLLSVVNYYVLPCKQFSIKRSVIPGSLFFCIFWLLGSWLFSLYVNELGTYNKVYGTIGAFAILMVWLYYSSVVMLIGGEINGHTLDKLTEKRKSC
ncbi:MAG: YihY/virulence factor BrkB family protein [Candidatus Gastranaerophilales bacterium]|nr:YihY/virulence factor BrkB family protein [Candidatus Gastranaerophilales bacterium]